jgi:hypothetical protein
MLTPSVSTLTVIVTLEGASRPRPKTKDPSGSIGTSIPSKTIAVVGATVPHNKPPGCKLPSSWGQAASSAIATIGYVTKNKMTENANFMLAPEKHTTL